MTKTGSPLFEVIFEANGKAVGKLRNEVSVKALKPFQTVNELATDEGPFQGGEGSAPTPLEFFITGLVGCLMTQIRVFSKKLKIPIEDLEVNCRAHWSAHPAEIGPYEGFPEGFDLDVNIVSSADSAEIEKLVRAARGGCFVEQTLAQANRVKHSISLREPNRADS